MKRTITVEIEFDPSYDRMSSVMEQLIEVVADDRYLASYVTGYRYTDQGQQTATARPHYPYRQA